MRTTSFAKGVNIFDNSYISTQSKVIHSCCFDISSNQPHHKLIVICVIVILYQVHDQRTTTISRQQEINQQRTRVQQLLTRMRTPAQFHRIRKASSLMKKIQIDPHSRTVSIQAHGQPNIVLKSQRGLKLKIPGKGGQPTKVINVLFKTSPSTQIASTPVFQPQNPQPIRTPPTPWSSNPTVGNALNTDNHPSDTRYVLLGQSSLQNRQGIAQHTGSGTGHQIRFLGDARATLEYLIRQKLLSTLSQTTSSSTVQNYVTSFATSETSNVNTNSQIYQAAPVESSTVPTQPSTTYFPYDYETEEPEYPNNA